ncbi:MAG: C25 family cysteine peptidase [Methanobacteriota archaeon]
MNKKTISQKTIVSGIMTLVLILSIIPTTGSSKIEPQSTITIQSNITDNPTIDLFLNTPTIHYGQISTEAGEFAALEIPGEGYTTNVGEAQLPTINRMIEIPHGANPELVIESTTWETTSLTIQELPSRILPIQPPALKLTDTREDATFTINENYYTRNSFTPLDTVQITDTGEIRGHRFILTQLSPIRYNPTTGELMILTSCKIHINLPGSNLEQTAEIQERYASSAFEDLLQTTLLNYGAYENQDRGDEPKTQTGYLIIVYDNFYEEIQPLVTWKQNLGYTVTTTKTSQIPNGPTANNIKTYITTAYNQWNPPPSYVLLVGDTAQIPYFTGQSTGTCTDLYFVTITQPDYFPDIIISRFPASTEAYLTNMVSKTLYYEQGNFATTDWIKKATFMASNDNYPVSEGTHNYVINTYLQPNGYTSDKLYCHTYGATTQQVRNALNNGRSLAIYSGHGDVTYWADGPYFSQSDVNGLTNNQKYPFVCSHACLTGQYSYAECFGETWLRTPNKGGLAFWGASDYTYWDEDDILEKRMFSAWWTEGLETIGGMTDRAKYLLYQYYGGGGMSRYYYEAYNVLGDSSVKIWHEPPAINVLIEGDCTYGDMTPVNDVSVQIINLNTGGRWEASTNNNHYTVTLAAGRDINASQTLRFIARDNDESANVTDHLITSSEISTGHITRNLILNIHYRDLKTFPFYPASMDTGAAVAQMMLNYLWWNSTQDPSGPPLHYPNQNTLFTEFNSQGGLWINGEEMASGLNSHAPSPIEQYGYFFSPSNSTNMNEVLQSICIWVDYSMSFYNQYHELPWPKPGYPMHVPVAIPTGGNYNSWMTVRGIHTDRDAWMSYPDFPAITVYGFWLNDPKTGGLGGNTYVTTQTFLATYFKPLNVRNDRYDGQYLAIIEPPQGIPEPEYQSVTIGQNPAGFSKQENIIVRSAQTMKTASLMKDLANTMITEKARRFVNGVLQYDTSDLAQIFSETQVNKKPVCNGAEWIVTFSHPTEVVFDVRLSAITGEPLQFSVI